MNHKQRAIFQSKETTVNIDEVVKMTGLSKEQIYLKVLFHKIPYTFIFGIIIFYKSDIESHNEFRDLIEIKIKQHETTQSK